MYEGLKSVTPLKEVILVETSGLVSLPIHVVVLSIVFPVIDCEVITIVTFPRYV
jgi:hypothetical protein